VQGCSNVTGLISHRFGETNPLIDEYLLLLRARLEDVDQCDYLTIFGNAHLFLPIIDTLIPSILNGFRVRLSSYDQVTALAFDTLLNNLEPPIFGSLGKIRGKCLSLAHSAHPDQRPRRPESLVKNKVGRPREMLGKVPSPPLPAAGDFDHKVPFPEKPIPVGKAKPAHAPIRLRSRLTVSGVNGEFNRIPCGTRPDDSPRRQRSRTVTVPAREVLPASSPA
jgi:hypothetical protein